MRELRAQLPRSKDLPNALQYRGQVDDSGADRKSAEDASPEYVDKAIAYITRGDRFVVFEEPDSPSVGIQVPGGTVEPGESLEAAVLREAYEETGLTNLRLVRSLGVQLHRRPSGRIHRRHYFHLVDESPTEHEVWEHYEEHPHSGSERVLYRLRWASLRRPPPLHAELDGAFQQLQLGLTRPHRPLRSLDRAVAGEHRYSTRALIIDEQERVLLLQGLVNGQETWIAPGGRVQPGETYCAALVRNLTLGGQVVNVGPIVWIRRCSAAEMGSSGGSGDFTELYFHARVRAAQYHPFAVDDDVIGHKWWSLDELARATTPFTPRALPTLLPLVFEGRTPSSLDIGL